MYKFNLNATISQAKPYKKIAKATHEHKAVPNHLNRNFYQKEPRKVLLTDILVTAAAGFAGSTAFGTAVRLLWYWTTSLSFLCQRRCYTRNHRFSLI